jgi:predicted phosphoribosyltransferase
LFGAIGAYYADFSQVADDEVIALLGRLPVAKSIRAKRPAA